jgi:hypothetical protein
MRGQLSGQSTTFVWINSTRKDANSPKLSALFGKITVKHAENTDEETAPFLGFGSLIYEVMNPLTQHRKCLFLTHLMIV